MHKLLTSYGSRLNRLREILFKGLFRTRFRYDVFISYSRGDTKDYAIALKKQLDGLDFTCFIDEEESPPGLSLGPTLEKALRRSAALVLLATERALTRSYVTLEVEKFIPTGRTIIPINISGTLTRDNEQALTKPPWNIIKSRQLIWLDETEEAFVKGSPSLSIADGIDKLFKYTHRNARVRAEIIVTAMVVLLATVGAAFVIEGQAAKLAEQSRLITAAMAERERQQEIADEATREAQRQLGIAEQAEKEAARQQQIAERARQEASHQQEIARAATSEAQRQQQLAANAKSVADQQQEIANQRLEHNRHLLYASDISLAQHQYEAGDMARVYELLNIHMSGPTTPVGDDLRSFNWYYLWRNSFRVLTTVELPSKASAFSLDGKFLATVEDDSTVKLYDRSTSQVLTKLEHPSTVTTMEFSPDSKRLASVVMYDDTIRVWDIGASKELATLPSFASGVVFSPDGRTLASTWGKELTLWDIDTGRELITFTAHSEHISSVAFSPDGKMFASASSDLTAKLWDVNTRQELARLEGHTGYLSSVVFSPDGKTLASTSMDGTIKLWDTKTYQEMYTFKGHLGRVNSAIFSVDGTILASASDDGVIKLWDVGARREFATLRGHTRSVSSLIFSPDGKTLTSISSDNSLKTWDLSAHRGSETILTEFKYGVDSVAFSPDGKALASGGWDYGIRIWDAETRKPLHQLGGRLVEGDSEDGYSARFLTFSRDGKLLASIGSFGLRRDGVKLWDTGTWRELVTIEEGQGQSFHAVAFSPDSKILALAAGDTIEFWDISTRLKLFSLNEPRNNVRSVAFSPDGRTLAATSWTQVKLWDINARRELVTLEGHTDAVDSVAFSPDGRTLASASRDKTVKLWDIVNWREVATLRGHLDEVNSVAFSPDGNTLASASDDDTVKLWEVHARQELATLREHSDNVNSVAFSSDGKMLASASEDQTVKLWIGATKEEVVAAHSKQ